MVTNSNDRHVGAVMRNRRRYLGFSQGWMGAKLGVSFSQIQKYENGSNHISAVRLQTIALHLGVPHSLFFAGLAVSEGSSQEECRDMVEAFCLIPVPEARTAVLELVRAMAYQIPRGRYLGP